MSTKLVMLQLSTESGTNMVSLGGAMSVCASEVIVESGELQVAYSSELQHWLQTGGGTLVLEVNGVLSSSTYIGPKNEFENLFKMFGNAHEEKTMSLGCARGVRVEVLLNGVTILWF